MRVAVVGAGLAGLGAARTLQQAGAEVVVFEALDQPGGRVTTWSKDGYIFDSGATIIAPESSELEQVMTKDLDRTDLIHVQKPIFIHSFGRVQAIDPQGRVPKRYTYKKGMATLPKLLAEPLDVRYGTDIQKLVFPPDGGVVVQDEAFSYIVLTPPIPQTREILENSGVKKNFNGSRYRKCLSILMGFERELDKPYHALIDPHQSEPLMWLSLESVKVPGDVRAPKGCTALVAQMSSRYSRYSFDKTEAEIIKQTKIDVSRILGKDFSEPVLSKVVYWPMSHVSNTLSFEAINKDPDCIFVASDGLIGARTQQAYEMGVKVAGEILKRK